MNALPGILLLVVVGLASQSISELVVMGTKHPLEASAVAVIIGIAIRNLKFVPKNMEYGVALSEKILIYGIVLLGVSLNVTELKAQGLSMLAIIVITMAVGFSIIYFLGKFFRLSDDLSILLAAGTTICGTSAIAITAPLIKAKQSETSYAIGTVALFGLIAILVYPSLGHFVGATDLQFGVFAGTAIHSTPQVVGAGYIFSDSAGLTATAVKLVRNCFMAPLAILIGVWWSKRSASSGAKIDIARAFPWFLFGYFIMAGLSSKGYFTKEGIDGLSNFGKFLILLGMAGVGLNTDLAAFKSVGVKPLIVGLMGSVVVAGISAVLIRVML